MLKLLIYIPNADVVSPRSIRTHQMCYFLSKSDIKVSIVTNDVGNPHEKWNSFNIHRLSASMILQMGSLYKYRTTKSWIGCQIARIFNKIVQSKSQHDIWDLQVSKAMKYIESINDEFDTLVLSIWPFSSYDLSSKLKEKYRDNIRIILDIGDPLAFNAASAYDGLDVEAYERRALEGANALIVTNEATKLEFKDRYNLDCPIEVVPQGFDPLLFTRVKKSTTSKKSISIIYAGALYSELRPIQPFVEGMLDCKDDSINLTICGVSTGSNSNRITYLPRMSQEELVKYYHGSDILLFIDNSYGVQTPGKIYELLAIGKPILFLYKFESETYHIAKKFDQIIFVKNETDSIAHILDSIDDLLMSLSSNYPDKHTWEQRAIKYKKAL